MMLFLVLAVQLDTSGSDAEPPVSHRWVSGSPYSAYNTMPAMHYSVRRCQSWERPSLEAIARQAFPVPPWLFQSEANLAHYRPEWNPPGSEVLVTEDLAGNFCGYVYCFFEKDQLYVRELASLRSSPGAGTMALGGALQKAVHAGAHTTRLNVMREHRMPQHLRAGMRDPVRYYERFGYKVIGASVSVVCGAARATDTRMTGNVAEIYSSVTSYLQWKGLTDGSA
ncbi:MAG TPA: hypothetical protein VFA65_10730 [Bryobacteraceae bacterium]|nr:hypothetical protein [Bryobacteraceae bacterium]